MRPELENKVRQSIRLLKTLNTTPEKPVEVAYSGGKDSDVILQLVKEAGLHYQAIYKNTTIDPPGTPGHARSVGAKVLMPQKSFFKLVEENGLPNRYRRFCCRYLKEYKVMDVVIMGVRKAESTKRANRYTEPTECRFYGSKKECIEAIYPILEWTNQDVKEFIENRGIKLHPIYYREDGTLDVSQRLGCLCCPLASRKKRILSFQAYPKMMRAYARALRVYRQNHPDVKTTQMYADEYEHLLRDIIYDSQTSYEEARSGMFEQTDAKTLLEDFFKVKL